MHYNIVSLHFHIEGSFHMEHNSQMFSFDSIGPPSHILKWLTQDFNQTFTKLSEPHTVH